MITKFSIHFYTKQAITFIEYLTNSNSITRYFNCKRLLIIFRIFPICQCLPEKCADQNFSFLGMNTSAAHNFFHQADSWRMYYWDMSCLSSRDWRVSHMLSHHLHTNTFNDLEVSGIEPFFAFLPSTQKNWMQKYLSHFYIQVCYKKELRFVICFLVFLFFLNYLQSFFSFQLFYVIAFLSEYMKKALVTLILQEDKIRPENLLPLLELWVIHFIREGFFQKT